MLGKTYMVNLHMRMSILVMAVVSAMTIYGQSSSFPDMADHFAACLCGNEPADIRADEIESPDVDKCRTLVWDAWCRAVLNHNGEALPSFRPLAEKDTFRWHMPHILEADTVMPFYFGTKGEKPAEGWPLFLYLHGSGPKDQEFATGHILCQRFDDAPSLYFIPQIPSEKHYRWWQRGKQHLWEQLLRHALAGGQIDVNRIYIFGISEGGYGSQRLASFYADYLAAAGPMAGGEVSENAPAENLGHIGFSFLTGAEDLMFGRNRLTQRAGDLLDSLQRLYPSEYNHSIQLIPNRGHHIDYSPTTPWLRTFKRISRPRHFIWEDFPMDGRYRRGFYNIEVIKRDTADGNERMRYEMNVCNNTIRVDAKRVQYHTAERESRWGIPIRQHTTFTTPKSGQFIVYLDESMADLEQPVTLIVNGRKVFRGKLTPNLQIMARSCVCFYDPERVFSTAISINLETMSAAAYIP